MNNSIKVGCYSTSISISEKVKNNLESYMPKGCPFDSYTMFDLLKDFVDMYSWLITKNTEISIINFIKILQENNYKEALVYGDDIISIIIQD